MHSNGVADGSAAKDRAPLIRLRVMPRLPVRRPLAVARDWAQVSEQIVRHAPRLVVADVDPAVAGWGANADQLHAGLRRVEPLLCEALPAGGRLIWVTNSTRFAEHLGDPPYCTPAGNRLLIGARKPLLRELHEQLTGQLRHPVVVVGDQWLTDGLLGWRLRARFVLLHHRRQPRPAWARLQQLAGLALIRPLYRKDDRRAQPPTNPSRRRRRRRS